jgi:DNA adenine methylase
VAVVALAQVAACQRRSPRVSKRRVGGHETFPHIALAETVRERPCRRRCNIGGTMSLRKHTDIKGNRGSRGQETAPTVVPTNSSGLPRGSNPKLMSPLRYPGAKRRLLPVIIELLDANFAGDKPVFVEPFAGGASVALGLLDADRVASVVLGELDPLLSAFWRVAISDAEWLVDKVTRADVTVAEWMRLHTNPGTSDRDLAWACLFLNRTSYSGILHQQAGPIGGRSQRSAYTIDCRFPRASLKLRLERIARWADAKRISVIDGDYREALAQAGTNMSTKGPRTVVYLDPPFYDKAKKLYRRAFTSSDHTELAKELKALKLPWVLSYDHAQFIVDLYGEHGGRRLVEMTYVASTGRSATRELIVTNLTNIPDDNRLEVLT